MFVLYQKNICTSHFNAIPIYYYYQFFLLMLKIAFAWHKTTTVSHFLRTETTIVVTVK